MRKLKDYCKIIMKKYLKIKRIVVCVVVVVVVVIGEGVELGGWIREVDCSSTDITLLMLLTVTKLTNRCAVSDVDIGNLTLTVNFSIF